MVSSKLGVAILGATILFGCAHLKKETPDDTPSEVDILGNIGTVDVAVVSVLPFNEYRTKLSASLGLNAEKAMAKAETLTELAIQRNVSQIGASVGRAFDNSGLFAGQTAQAAAPSTPTASNPLDLGTVARAKDLTPPALGALEPNLALLGATALLQEALLLESYLKHAPVPNKYDAYLVRLQITLMPRRPGLKLDAYTSLAFVRRSSPSGPPSTASLAQGTVSDILKDYTLAGGNFEIPRGAEGQPIVIPLLVADNIEALSRERSEEDLRRFSVSVLSMLGALKATDVSLGYFKDALESVIGRELRSLKAVGRINQNTLRVMLGAQSDPRHAYSMVRRSHYVTVLVAVPRATERPPVRIDEYTAAAEQSVKVELVARTSFVNSRTGRFVALRLAREQLSARQVAWFALEFAACLGASNPQAAQRALQETKPEETWSTPPFDAAMAERLQTLVGYTTGNDVAGFTNEVQKTATTACNRESLWTALSDAGSRGMIDQQTLTFDPVPRIFLPPDQPVFIEAKKDAVVATVFGGLRVDQLEPLTAILEYEDKGMLKKQPALAVVPGHGGRALIATFPPFKTEDKEIGRARISFRSDIFELDSPTMTWPKAGLAPTRLSTASLAEEPRVLFVLSGTSSLSPDRSRVPMRLDIGRPQKPGAPACADASHFLSAEPAVIVDSNSAVVQVSGGKAYVKDVGAAILTLDNLHPKRTIELLVHEKCGDKVEAVSKPLVVTVF